MLLVVHAAIGAVAGNAIGNPAGAFAAGVVSHFLTDLIPHGDEGLYNDYQQGKRRGKAIGYLALDIAATFLLVLLAFRYNDYFHPWTVAAGIVGGVIPDVLVGIAELVKPEGKRRLSRLLKCTHSFHMKNHHYLIKLFREGERDIHHAHGILMQMVVLGCLLFVML